MLDENNRAWAVEYLAGIPHQFEILKKETRKLNRSYQSIDSLCKKQHMDSQQYLKLLKKIKKQIAKIEGDDMYQLVTMTMPSALKIMRDEEFDRLDSPQEEGQEIARKGTLYTELIMEGTDLLKAEADQIFEEYQEAIQK